MIDDVLDWLNSVATLSEPVLKKLEPVLEKLEPLSIWVIAFGGLLFLAALFGGGFSIRSISIPHIGTIPRLLSGFVGAALIAVFFAIPTGATFDLTGEIAFNTPPASSDNVYVRLIKIGNPLETTIHDGTFKFLKRQHAIEEGQYRIQIGPNQGAYDSFYVVIEEGKNLVLSQRPNGKFRLDDSGSLVEHLFKIHRRENWQNQISAVEHLSRLAIDNKEVEKILQNKVTAREKDALLAGFALANTCRTHNTETIALMETVWSDRSVNPYRRIRALASLNCDPDKSIFVKEQLFKLAAGKHPMLKRYPAIKVRGIPRVAAYHLVKNGERKICLVKELLTGLSSKFKIVRDRSFQALSIVAGQNHPPPNLGDWKKWLGSTAPKLEKC